MAITSSSEFEEGQNSDASSGSPESLPLQKIQPSEKSTRSSGLSPDQARNLLGLKYYSEETRYLKKSLEEQKSELETNKKEIETLRSEMKDWQDKLDENKFKAVEILGIFVALFTFVSVDFQLFRDPPSWNAAFGVVLVTSGILIVFILVLETVLITTRNQLRDGIKRRFIKLYCLAGALILVGISAYAVPILCKKIEDSFFAFALTKAIAETSTSSVMGGVAGTTTK